MRRKFPEIQRMGVNEPRRTSRRAATQTLLSSNLFLPLGSILTSSLPQHDNSSHASAGGWGGQIALPRRSVSRSYGTASAAHRPFSSRASDPSWLISVAPASESAERRGSEGGGEGDRGRTGWQQVHHATSPARIRNPARHHRPTARGMPAASTSKNPKLVGFSRGNRSKPGPSAMGRC